MSKLDDLKRTAGANARHSLGLDDAGQGGAAPVAPVAVPPRLQGLVKEKNAAAIPLDRIIPDPDQPREHFDDAALAHLADSLRARGVLQPLRVRWDEARGLYILIAGERRWRAAGRAGLERVPCVIHDGAVPPGELLALQLIENVLREDLRPVEQAKGYRRLMEAHGWSAREVARELHLPASTVHRALELLELPEPVQDLVEDGRLAPATACEVGRLGPRRSADQVALARRAADELWTRAAAVEAVMRRKAGHDLPAPAPAPASTSGSGRVRPAKAEIRLDDGHRVTVTGPAAAADPEALVEVLRRALKKAQAAARTRGDTAA